MKTISLTRLLGISAMLLTLQPTLVNAETPEEKGFAIAARSDRSDRGFIDTEVNARMVLYNAHGQSTERKMIQRIKEVQDESVGDKSIIIFETPADVSGTAFLSHANILEADDQWLYLPDLKKIKRISSRNKSGPFLGSEFAFEDFTSQELNKYTYKFIREEPCPDMKNVTCDVSERYPEFDNSGYTKQVSWVDQKDYQVRKIDFYDRKDALAKTLTFSGYKKYADKYWRAQELKMVNHLNGKKTDFLFDEFTFNVGFSDKEFEKGILTRLR
ncbi:MAG: outer membrane lipoprotein-sorting protein [Alphaproteobacteria bacterium]